MQPDSKRKTLFVAFIISFVCSILVSAAAVLLKPVQEKNQIKDVLKNVIQVAGIDERSDINEILGKKLVPKLLDMETYNLEDIKDIGGYYKNFKKMLNDDTKSIKLKPDEDLAGIGRIPKKVLIYYVKGNNSVNKIIVPIYGKGLWSTLYGFLCINAKDKSICGITFYEHKETPGLGGEVDNPNWKRKWVGKMIYDKGGRLKLTVIKGEVNPDSAEKIYQVDGLSGASLTTAGVNNMVKFWLGDRGYKKFLMKNKF